MRRAASRKVGRFTRAVLEKVYISHVRSANTVIKRQRRFIEKRNRDIYSNPGLVARYV